MGPVPDRPSWLHTGTCLELFVMPLVVRTGCCAVFARRLSTDLFPPSPSQVRQFLIPNPRTCKRLGFAPHPRGASPILC